MAGLHRKQDWLSDVEGQDVPPQIGSGAIKAHLPSRVMPENAALQYEIGH
jgi:hypothetical protein